MCALIENAQFINELFQVGILIIVSILNVYYVMLNVVYYIKILKFVFRRTFNKRIIISGRRKVYKKIIDCYAFINDLIGTHIGNIINIGIRLLWLVP